MATFLAHVPRKTLLAVKRVAGAQFACFTGTKVRMLTPEELQYFLVAATVQDILARFKQAYTKKEKNSV